MRTVRSRSLAGHLLAALLLFSMCGPLVSRMTCLMSGRTVVSIGSIKDCCPARVPSDRSTLSGVCCLFDQAQVRPDELVNPVPVEAPDTPVLTVEIAGISDRLLFSFAPLHALQQRGPPLTTQERLQRLCVART